MATQKTEQEEGRLLFDTQAYIDFSDDQECYDTYLEELEGNDIDTSEYPEKVPPMGNKFFNDFFQWCIKYAQRDYEDFMDNMEYSDYNKECVLYGKLGLWDGSPEIDFYKFDTITEAIERCWGGSIEDMDARLFGDRIELNAHHHDGTNHFIIKLLSDKGTSALTDTQEGVFNKETEEWEYPDFKPEGENILPMPEYLF